MKESTAWYLIAMGLGVREQTKEYTSGICREVVNLVNDGHISWDRKYDMIKRLYDTFAQDGAPGFFWPEGEIAPRFDACILLSELAAAEGK